MKVTTGKSFDVAKEGCFKLVGYPDWWDDLQKRKAATKAPAYRTGGKANLATTDHPVRSHHHMNIQIWIWEKGRLALLNS